MAIGLGGWVAFNAFILCMLALDLGVFHRKAHVVRVREAAIWTGVWIALALLFNLWLYYREGSQVALEFLTGYLIEKSLSVDNIFVIVMIFAFFGVPAAVQHRVLFWGVIGALVMRGAFIGAGTYVLQHWHGVIYVFGALLVVTGIRMALKTEEEPDLSKNPLVRLTRRILPVATFYDGQRFLTMYQGRRMATPLLLVLILVEVSDVLFAVDSIPAIFAITDKAFIVYTSNVFAILGLRSMYFMLGDIVHRFVYLKYGLAVVLVFIGVKMLVAEVYHVPTLVSLGVVAVSIGGAMLASAFAPSPPPEAARSDGDDPAAAA